MTYQQSCMSAISIWYPIENPETARRVSQVKISHCTDLAIEISNSDEEEKKMPDANLWTELRLDRSKLDIQLQCVSIL